MNGDRFTLDANILVYSIDTKNSAKRGRALDVLSLTVQALGEFYWVAKRKNKASSELIAKLVDRWSTAFPVVHADVDRLREAVAVSEITAFRSGTLCCGRRRRPPAVAGC